MFYIFPILFVTYKFIKWFRYSKYLKSIIKVSNFNEILSLAKSNNASSKKEFLVSIYTFINSSGPLLALKTFTNSNSTTTNNTAITTTSNIMSEAIKGSNILNNGSNSYLAIESTKSLLFQCSRSATGVISTVIQQQYNSVPILRLTDITNKSIEIMNDEIQLPLEKTFSSIIPIFTEDPQYIKIFDFIFGRRKIIGQLIEEKVFKSNSKLFTVLSCKFDSVSKSLSYRILNLPFQFSENKLDKEISNADFKTQMYGGFLIGFGVSILVYYGVPMIRDYLFKLKLNKTKASTPEEMQRTCAICYEQPRDIVFIPCNHVLTCNSCSGFITSCPLCRSQISSKRRLIF